MSHPINAANTTDPKIAAIPLPPAMAIIEDAAAPAANGNLPMCYHADWPDV